MAIIPTDIALRIISYLHKTVITWAEPVEKHLIKCVYCNKYHGDKITRKYNHYTADIIDPVNITTALALRLVSTDCARAFSPVYIHLKIGGDFGVSEYIRLMKYNFTLAKPFIMQKIKNYEGATVISKFENYYWDIEPYINSNKCNPFTNPDETSATLSAKYMRLYPSIVMEYTRNIIKSVGNSLYGYLIACETPEGGKVGLVNSMEFNTEDGISYSTWDNTRIEQRIHRVYRVVSHTMLPDVQNEEHNQPIQLEQLAPKPMLKKQKRQYQHNRKNMQRMNKMTQRKQKYQKNYR